MIATDVASRGLDVKDIKTVINYDFPSATEDYVHRIGRTGRAGEKGLSVTFFTRNDAKKARDLIALQLLDVMAHQPLVVDNINGCSRSEVASFSS